METATSPVSGQTMCTAHFIDNCPLCRSELERKNSRYLPELIDLEIALESKENEINKLRNYIKVMERKEEILVQDIEDLKNTRFEKLDKVTALLGALNELTK